MTCQGAKCAANKNARCVFAGREGNTCTMSTRALIAQIFVSTSAVDKHADRIRIAARVLEARLDAKEATP